MFRRFKFILFVLFIGLDWIGLRVSTDFARMKK